MKKELYFDISNEAAGGSLYRLTGDNGSVGFQYQHSTYDENTDEVKVFDTPYADFTAWWKMLTADARWYYQHPLFVHPEVRDFVRAQLAGVNWGVSPDRKWQESHQRQWKKVLEGGGSYYRG